MDAKHRGLLAWLGIGLLGLVLAALVGFGCSSGTNTPPPTVPTQPAYTGPPYFKDMTAESGVDHTYRNGQDKGHLAIIESLGGGCALIDYDGDGLLDIVFAGGGDFDKTREQFEKDKAKDKNEAVPPRITGRPLKVYKNLGNWKFQDVTKEVGLDQPVFYTHGCAVADYDRDGWPDLLVTGWGRVVLYHNEPDGKGGRRFVDVTEKAGLVGVTWGTSAAWADLDGDGFPDLYLCQYADWNFDPKKGKHPSCTYDGHTPDVCPPKQFYPLPHMLFHNLGNGTFKDVSKEAGLRVPRDEKDYEPLWKDLKEESLASGRAAKETLRRLAQEAYKRLRQERGVKEGEVLKPDPERELRDKADGIARATPADALPHETQVTAEKIATNACDLLRATDKRQGEPEYGKGLGVIITDFNGDGRPDVYVADDTVDNLMYMNRSTKGKILLEEVGLAAGVARTSDGLATGSMGLAVGDPLNQGRPAIYVTTYEGELHSLFLNECVGDKEYFRYATQASGIGAIGQIWVGWGTDFIDLDHHGWEDIFVSNGHAIRFPKGKAKRAQTPMLLQNAPWSNTLGRRYENITARGGDYFKTVHCGRGVAFGDLDNDGQKDMVLCHLNEPSLLLKNQAPTEGRRWIGVELAGKGYRDVVGARVHVDVGPLHLTRFAKGGGSYASANDPRHVFGLGDFRGDKVTVTVSWPRGETQSWEGLAVGRYWKLTEGVKDAK
jgi:hypothetical protein